MGEDPFFICKECGGLVYLIDSYSKKRKVCNNCREKLREAGISRTEILEVLAKWDNDEWVLDDILTWLRKKEERMEDKCAIHCNGANENCNPCPYPLKASGGVDKSIDSLHLSFKCPYCNHQISIKKEDLDGI